MVIEIESVEGGRSLEEIAEDIGVALHLSPLTRVRIRELLLEFAEEIKRQSIEP